MASAPHPALSETKARRALRCSVSACVFVSGAFLLFTLVKGVRLECGGFHFRSTRSLRPLTVLVVSGLLSIYLSRREGPRASAPARFVRGIKLCFAFPRTGSATVKASWIVAAALSGAHIAFCVRQELLAMAAQRLYEVGSYERAAETLLSTTAWPLGTNASVRAKAAYYLHRAGESERVRALLEEAFERGSSLGFASHRALFTAYTRLGQPSKAREVYRRALQAHPKRSEEIVRNLAWLDRTGMQGGSSLVQVELRCDLPALRPSAVEVAGNWARSGEYSDLDGWVAAPMAPDGSGSWRARLSLAPSRELPYLGVARARDETGALVPVGVAHFVLPLEPGADSVVGLQPLTGWTASTARRAPRSLGDGRCRVFALWPDGGSWALLRMFEQLGYMPHTAELLAQGSRMEMISTDPPFTATAYLRMIGVSGDGDDSAFGWLRLAALQVNGIPYLDWLVPDSLGTLSNSEENTLYRVLEEHGYPAIAMVFNDDHIFAADDRRVPAQRGYASASIVLAAESVEHRSEPVVLDLDALDRSVEGTGRQDLLDEYPYLQYCLTNTAENARRGLECWVKETPDFLLLRLPAVDLASHKYFATLAESPARNPLVEVYRQIDVVLGLVARTLDEDDTLILVSDHGIQGLLQHDRACVFIAAGPGIPPGKAMSTIPIHHFPALVCARFGIEGAFGALSEDERAVFLRARGGIQTRH